MNLPIRVAWFPRSTLEEREMEEISLNIDEREVTCHRTQFMLKTDSTQDWGAALFGWMPDSPTL